MKHTNKMKHEKISASIDPNNPNCFNVYINGIYYTNVGAESEKTAIELGHEIRSHQIKGD